MGASALSLAEPGCSAVGPVVGDVQLGEEAQLRLGIQARSSGSTGRTPVPTPEQTRKSRNFDHLVRVGIIERESV